MKFVKKPVVIEATQWFKNGDHPAVLAYHVASGAQGQQVQLGCSVCGEGFEHHGRIDTLEGPHIVCPGDWIITGVKGEHYPCKPDIFEATYENYTDDNKCPQCNGKGGRNRIQSPTCGIVASKMF